eukprot:CAMPEP_0172541900 /NCGR_PEP_ID=MMETSP1067-20121228/12622_1 /TAXON_ID=265564 ORGANISM="Thalassiosira punctigera, Strain Tpunct2005C2" /NCGR_SAMPLE_ID=MMETSP1067 /ASSEMBLY_ACC=CAM_ASM_000444 /LENGTH=581 /DNA_ID=CAMNT_0013328027 /DNA_START=70 /DNA_END=1815 /DNA_ORIENTATION=-
MILVWITEMNSATATAGTAAALTFGLAWLAYRSWSKKAACPNAEPSDDPLKQGFSMKKIPQNLDAVVIGSGLGGLTTAALLAKEGKRVLVLEQHDIAGGNLHTFVEKGYEFDTGLHYVGARVGDKRAPLRKLLDYVSDESVEWAQLEDDYDVASSGDDEYHIYSGWAKVKKELKASFPEEGAAIDKYFEVVHRTGEYLFPALTVLKMLPEPAFNACMWLFSRQFAIFDKTTNQVLETLTSNRKLMGVLAYHFGDYGEFPGRGAFVMHAVLASHFRSGAYYPIGGPTAIAASIVRLIERWGGRVMVRSPVESILIDEKDRACGVLVKGREIFAKSVVSSVGAPATMTKLLPESHRGLVGRQIDAMRDPDVASFGSLMSLFVGINDADKSLELPRRNYWVHKTWDHDENLAEMIEDRNDLPAFFVSFSSAKDPTYKERHPGKQVALVIGACAFEDVERFKDDRVKHRSEEYVAMKEKWQELFLKVLLDKFPELEEKIDFVDCGTALTNDFYLGTHRGAVYGLAHTPKRFAQHWLRAKTPVKNLYLTGQDVACCGINGALAGAYVCAYAMEPRCLPHTWRLWTP